MEEIGARGYPKEATSSEDEKKVVVSNSVAPFSAILEEKEFQDGGQNRLKINKKVHENLSIFC